MLSRVADSMFWMSRYIERAENVARFIDVNWHLILDSSIREESQWLALVNTTGDLEVFEKREGAATRESVIQFLTFDTENANSILSCVRAARENARCIRDAISQEMWEQINMFYLMLNDSASGNKALVNPYDFFNEVKMASHLFVGINDTTMSHNEAWNFCRLGRYLERTDKTSRILDVKYYMLRAKLIENPSPSDDIQWAAMLKSASALEMYRKFRDVSFAAPSGPKGQLQFDALETWEKRFVVSAGGNGGFEDVGGWGTDSLVWLRDNVKLPVNDYIDACWQAPYKLNNLFGDSVHGANYYAPFDHEIHAKRVREIGGVCGSLASDPARAEH